MWDKALPYDPVGGAVADTEREILGYAMDDFDLENDEIQDSDDLVDELSEVSGWDGEALGLDEIAHRNIYGNSYPLATDRPFVPLKMS